MSITKLPVIAEGKTKIVHSNPDDDGTVYLYFKDDITAGDGAKHDVIEGKAVLDWAISRDCKDDPLHDPMLDDRYIDYMVRSKNAWEYPVMREMNAEILLLLEGAFSEFDVQLVDLKLEYGVIDGEMHLIDQISGGSFRLWPYRHNAPKLDRPNVLSELAPEKRLDKDTYRMGEAADSVLSKFHAISMITAGFKGLP